MLHVAMTTGSGASAYQATPIRTRSITRGGDSHTLCVDLGCSDLLAKQQHQLLRCWQYVDFKR